MDSLHNENAMTCQRLFLRVYIYNCIQNEFEINAVVLVFLVCLLLSSTRTLCIIYQYFAYFAAPLAPNPGIHPQVLDLGDFDE